MINTIPALSVMTFTFEGPPVPYVRMTKNSMWADPKAKAYLGYKKQLAEALKAAHPDWVVGPGPCSKTESYKRSKWIKEQKKFGWEVWVTAYIDELYKGDFDNFLKTAVDGLKLAQFFYDDAVIMDGHAAKREDKDNPRLEITLERRLL